MRRLLVYIVVAAPAVMLLVGCVLLAHELSGGHYQTYYKRGLERYRADKYLEAKGDFLRAYHEAQAGLLGYPAEAAALYNYSLASGHCGEYLVAENAMKSAMELDERTEGPRRWLELARMYSAEGKHSDAVLAYKRGVFLAKRHGFQSRDPISYAESLEGLAEELRATDESAEATEYVNESKLIRASHPGAHPIAPLKKYPRAVGNPLRE